MFDSIQEESVLNGSNFVRASHNRLEILEAENPVSLPNLGQVMKEFLCFLER